MSRLYHPAWVKTNGELGGAIFQDWCKELLPYGSKGVLQGIAAVRNLGSSYAPNLNKFLALCRNESDAADQVGANIGPWETCPYTGRQRRLKNVLSENNPRVDSAGRFIDDERTDQEIREDIEKLIASGASSAALVKGRSVPLIDD